jgi:glutamate/tyrosine decarboxylase-like PLP-dependent enzyme
VLGEGLPYVFLLDISSSNCIGYFDVEEKYVYCTEKRFVLDPKQAVKLVDENTIGICVILGSTFNGEYESVLELCSESANRLGTSRP